MGTLGRGERVVEWFLTTHFVDAMSTIGMNDACIDE